MTGSSAALDADAEALAYLSITRLQAAYADVVTRRVWSELEPLFLPGAPIHVDTVTADVLEFVGATSFGEFVAGSIERFEFFEFVILNTVIDVASSTNATGRMYMVELRQDRTSGGWSNAFGVYHDSYTFADGRWQFAERSYQSLARTGRYEIFPFPSKFAGPLG
jgi:SnoaL-like protein